MNTLFSSSILLFSLFLFFLLTTSSSSFSSTSSSFFYKAEAASSVHHIDEQQDYKIKKATPMSDVELSDFLNEGIHPEEIKDAESATMSKENFEEDESIPEEERKRLRELPDDHIDKSNHDELVEHFHAVRGHTTEMKHQPREEHVVTHLEDDGGRDFRMATRDT